MGKRKRMINGLSIAYVLPEFVTEKEAGGLATYYDNISRMLADIGNTITIFVLSDRNEQIDYYPGVSVNRLFFDKSQVDSLIPGSFMRFWSKEINNYVRKYIRVGNRIDIIQYANYMGLGFDRLDEIPTIMRLSSFNSYMREASKLMFNPNMEFTCERIADYIEMISVIKADAVYSPSSMLASIIKKETNILAEVIESPFYPSKIEKKQNCELYLENKRYLITFSTLNLLKGIKLIGDSIEDVLRDNPNLLWVFAGQEVSWVEDNGEEILPSEYIIKKAGIYADRIIFLGKTNHSELMNIVENAEICIMPSRIDNLPNTCIEAMALGKIVVGTKGASFEQLIDDGNSGFLIERENRKALIDTINKIMKLESEEKKKIGINAKKRIELMSPQLITERLMKLYSDTISNFNGEKKYLLDITYKKYIKKYNELLKQTKITGAMSYLLY